MKFLKNARVWQLAVLLLADALVFGLTDAAEVPSYMLIVGFGLLVLTIYYVVHALVSLSAVYGLPIHRKKPLTLYLTGVAGGLIALQSIGELGKTDVLVLLPLAVIGYIYSAYAKSSRL